MINLISDTVTKPTPGMLKAMHAAEVGDDVFGDDPSVNALEEQAADLFGHEAAVFCPSGTMTNQLAIKLHTSPLDEVLCDHDSHIWQYESAGFAWHSGVKINPIVGQRGKLSLKHLEDKIQPAYDWLPRTKLVVLENTANRGGGAVYRLDEVEPIAAFCAKNNLGLHLDGARLMNALVKTGENPKLWGKSFDSISLCLSKGLGAPVGSVLTGSKPFVKEARRFRKIMGGGMRQAGFLAAAASYALTHQVDRLQEDHQRASRLGRLLQELPYVANVRPVETNIIIFDLKDNRPAQQVLTFLEKEGVRASAFGASTIRFVTHLHVSDADIARVESVLKRFTP